jgi:hypothetical protein
MHMKVTIYLNFTPKCTLRLLYIFEKLYMSLKSTLQLALQESKNVNLISVKFKMKRVKYNDQSVDLPKRVCDKILIAYYKPVYNK